MKKNHKISQKAVYYLLQYEMILLNFKNISLLSCPTRECKFLENKDCVILATCYTPVPRTVFGITKKLNDNLLSG